MKREGGMNKPLIEFRTIQADLRTGPDMTDITGKLEEAIRETEIENGTVSLTMVGSTGSITTIEYEPGVVMDLKRAINNLAPQGLEYEHEKAWHDGNGHSHVQAALLGPSLQVPVRKGRLGLGTWQQVVAINHDNKPRQRNIEVSIIGLRKD